MKTLKQAALSLAMTTVTLTPSVQSMAAGNLNIAKTPLLLAAQAPANVYWMIDDSGSMDWDYITEPYFRESCYTGGGGCWKTSMITSGQMTWNDDDWRELASDFNKMFYDPRVSYTPWAGVAAYGNDADFEEAYADWIGIPRIGNSSYEVNLEEYSEDNDDKAPEEGFIYPEYSGQTVTVSWTRDCEDSRWWGCNRWGPYYQVYTYSPVGFSYNIAHDTDGINYSYSNGNPYINNNDKTNTPNGMIDYWDEYTQVDIGKENKIVLQHRTRYDNDDHDVRPATNITPEELTGSAQDKRDYLSGVKPLPDKNKRYYIEGAIVNTVKTNIANWYQYYRTRMLTAKAAVGKVMVRSPGFYYGLDSINKNDSGDSLTRYMATSIPNMPAHNETLLNRFYGNLYANDGTPLRSALKRAGQFYQNSDIYESNGKDRSPPIKFSCQASYTILMSDGYWNGGNPKVGNQDGDSHSNTLADVAHYYYSQDLSAKGNNVPPSEKDPRMDQHMVTFTVAFGLQGNLVDNDGDGWPEEDRSGNPIASFGVSMDTSASGATAGKQPGDGANWGANPNNNEGPDSIDDMWHAAWNSHGIYKSAGNPEELVTALSDALGEIEARSLTSSGVAASSGALVTGAALYQPSYDTENWSGDLVERPLNATNGNIEGTGWKASNNLRNWGTRTLITMKPAVLTNPGAPGLNRTRSGTGVAFGSGVLSPLQIAELNGDAANKVRWLRGDRAMEEKNGGVYRDRPDSGATSTTPPLIGDIVDSTPVYVGAPRKGEKGATTAEKSAYTTFVNNKSGRLNMVYVGANDGIMHGFNGDNGAQEFGYIPNMLMPKLHLLTSPAYTHEFYVNTTATVEDVYTATETDGADWRTMLVSGLGQGGQGLFALDVTNPTSMNQSNAANVVLWEYEDETQVTLDTQGFVYGMNSDAGGNMIPGSFGSGDGVTAKLNEDYGSASVGHIFGPQPVAPTNAPGSSTTVTTAVIFGNGYNASAPDTHKDNSPTKLKNLIQSRLDTLPNHPGGNVPQDPIYGNNLGNSGFSQYRYQTLSQAFDDDALMFVDAAMDNGSTFSYNSMTVNKGNPVTVPTAALMIVDAGTGKLVKKIPVVSPQSNPSSSHYDASAVDNGLSTPVLYDINGDDRVDYAYAGDLHGNLWKFNLTDTNPNNWHVEGQTNAGEKMPFFVGIPERPVITRPAIIENTDSYTGGLLIAFGTGKFLEASDKNADNQTEIQYFYTLWDKLEFATVAATIEHTDSNIREQFISNEQNIDGLRFRTTSDYPVNWNNHVGWKMRLRLGSVDKGERVVNNPLIRNGRIIFTTFMPNEDPCDAGGSGWLMELNVFDGGPIEGQQPFDVNGDGIIDIADINEAGGIISGVSQPGGGFPSMPTIVESQDGDVEYKYSSNSGGELSKITESSDNSLKGRQSWRYLLRK